MYPLLSHNCLLLTERRRGTASVRKFQATYTLPRTISFRERSINPDACLPLFPPLVSVSVHFRAKNYRPFSQAAIYSRASVHKRRTCEYSEGCDRAFIRGERHSWRWFPQAGRFRRRGERWRRSCEKETNQPFTVTPVNTHISSKGCSSVSKRRSCLFSILPSSPSPPLFRHACVLPFFSLHATSFSVWALSCLPRRVCSHPPPSATFLTSLARSHSH